MPNKRKQPGDDGRLLDLLTHGGADVVLAQQFVKSAPGSSSATETTVLPVPVAESTRSVSRPGDQVLLVLDERVFDAGLGQGGAHGGLVQLSW